MTNSFLALYKNKPLPVISGQWDGKDPNSFEKKDGQLWGGLFWQKLVKPDQAFTFIKPQILHPAEGLVEVARIATTHSWGYYGFFKPSVEEVWQCLEKTRNCDQEVVAFEILSNDVRMDKNEKHVATTILYAKDKKNNFPRELTQDWIWKEPLEEIIPPKELRRIEFDKRIEERIKATTILIEATSFEKQNLWSDWYYTPKYNGIKLPWGEHQDGIWQKIGEIDNRPICISISWDKIGNQTVGFYEGTSQLVDHEMITDWIIATFTNKVYRGNAQNFHNAVYEIERLDGIEYTKLTRNSK